MIVTHKLTVYALCITLISVLPFPGAGDKDETGVLKESFVAIPGGKINYCRPILASGIAENPNAEFIQVNLSAFEIAVYEVTERQFAEFVAATNYKTSAEKGLVKAEGFGVRDGKFKSIKEGLFWNNLPFDRTADHPVTCVTYSDAVAYCEWRSANDAHYDYRLPTGAEWERGCQLANGRLNDFPDGDGAKHTNFQDESFARFDPRVKHQGFDDGFAFTAPVDAKLPGFSGLVFLHGNVSEMATAEFAAPPELREKYMLVCGGSWFCSATETQLSHPLFHRKDSALTFVGFRLLRKEKPAEKDLP